MDGVVAVAVVVVLQGEGRKTSKGNRREDSGLLNWRRSDFKARWPSTSSLQFNLLLVTSIWYLYYPIYNLEVFKFYFKIVLIK